MWSKAEIFRNYVIVMLIAADAALFYYFSIQADTIGIIVNSAVVFLLIAAAYAFIRYKKNERASKASRCLAQQLGYGVSASTFNHLLILFDRPLIDKQLAHLDVSIGFHWPSYVNYLQEFELLDYVSTIAYNSSFFQIIFVIVFLSFTSREDKLDRVLNVFVITSLITILFWAVYPSIGAFAYYVSVGEIAEVSGVTVDRANVDLYFYYKSGEWNFLNMSKYTGLIGFPSYHAVMAIVTIYSMWGVKRLFITVFILNIFVLYSVPVDGSHHLSDLFGGVCLALLVIMVIEMKTIRLSDMLRGSLSSTEAKV